MSFEADERIARIEAQLEESQRIAATAQKMRESIEGLRAIGHDSANVISVTVNSAGHMVDVQFTGASRLNDTALSAAMSQAYQDAIRQVRAKVADLTEEAFGGDSDLSQRILSPYDKMMPRSDNPTDDSSQHGNGHGAPNLKFPFNR